MAKKKQQGKVADLWTARLDEEECICLKRFNPNATVLYHTYKKVEFVSIGHLSQDLFDFDGVNYITVIPLIKRMIVKSFEEQRRLALSFG